MKFNKIHLLLTVLFLIIAPLELVAQQKNSDCPVQPIKVNISTQENLQPLKLDLCSALKMAQDNNLNIAIKKDKVDESQLKLDEVKSKRLFFFFKFANAGALEDSAVYSLEASKLNLDSTVNDVLAETSKKYYNLVQSMLAREVAREFLKKGELALQENQKLLEEGSATKFDVKQTEVFVENLKQKSLEAEIAYMLSSVDLAQYINEKSIKTNIVPHECSSNDAKEDIKIEILTLVPDDILLNDSIDYALANRPELNELEYKIKSLDELIKATKLNDIKVKTIKSQGSQLQNTLDLMKNTVKATVTQSLLQLIGAKSQIDVAEKKYNLSQKALEHAKIIRKEGFTSNKDVLDAQVNLSQSKNDYIKAIITYNVSQINLLKELGLIKIDTIVNNKPIEIPKAPASDNSDINDPVKVLNKDILIIKNETDKLDKSTNKNTQKPKVISQ